MQRTIISVSKCIIKFSMGWVWSWPRFGTSKPRDCLFCHLRILANGKSFTRTNGDSRHPMVTNDPRIRNRVVLRNEYNIHYYYISLVGSARRLVLFFLLEQLTVRILSVSLYSPISQPTVKVFQWYQVWSSPTEMSKIRSDLFRFTPPLFRFREVIQIMLNGL